MDEGSGRSLCKGRRQCGATRDGKLPAEMRGLDQVRGKNRLVGENFEVHSSKVGGAVFGRGYFRRAVRCGR